MTYLTVLHSAKERKWADSQKCSTALQNEQREEVSTYERATLYMCIHTCICCLLNQNMLMFFRVENSITILNLFLILCMTTFFIVYHSNTLLHLLIYLF